MQIRKQYLPPDHWALASTDGAWGSHLARLGRHAEAEQLLLSAYARLVKARGVDALPTKRVAQRLADLMVRAARPAGATGEGVGQTAQAIAQDMVCAGSSLWVYNASTTTCEIPSSPPNGARILCFKGTGTADLHAYSWFEYPCLPAGSPTCVPTLVKRTWDHQVTRYWPGTDAGMFWDATCTGWYCVAERFKASQACTVAGSIAKTANRVCLGTGC